MPHKHKGIRPRANEGKDFGVKAVILMRCWLHRLEAPWLFSKAGEETQESQGPILIFWAEEGSAEGRSSPKGTRTPVSNASPLGGWAWLTAS